MRNDIPLEQCPSKAELPLTKLQFFLHHKNAKAFSNAHLQLPLRNDLPMQRYYRIKKNEKVFIISVTKF